MKISTGLTLIATFGLICHAITGRRHHHHADFLDMPNLKDFFKLMKEPTPFARNIETLDDFFTAKPDTTPNTPLARLKVGDMAQCLQLLQQILVEAIQAYNEAKEKKWSELIPAVIQIAKDAYDDYDCFKNSDKKQFLRDTLEVALSQGDQKQCILDNLQKALNNAVALVGDVFSSSWDDIANQIQNIIQNVQDALAC